ncbi:hypothetical protein MBLNU230_g2356t1 [Neophaeotheca triangularis]
MQTRRACCDALKSANAVLRIARGRGLHVAAPKADYSFRKLRQSIVERGYDGQATIHGFLGTRRNASKSLTFAELHDPEDREEHIQLVFKADKDDVMLNQIRNMPDHSVVAVAGVSKVRKTKSGEQGVELEVSSIHVLNEFPSDIIMAPETRFSPEQRHLQLRNSKEIRDALNARSRIATLVRESLLKRHGFVEIETPILFKSTPEGAREFLVPTRTQGHAYALPQSPQQYKQILMASGIHRYMQIAKCFRDEDLRADRQPEFTQIDLEMSFADGQDVMKVIESLVASVWCATFGSDELPPELVSANGGSADAGLESEPPSPSPFQRMTYEHAMNRYGSDKPDLRLGAEIHKIDYMLPVDLVSKLGPLTDPIVEVFKLPISEDAQETRDFVTSFMDSPASHPFTTNPEGQPGIFIYDTRKPLQGLQPFGFEAAEAIEDLLSLEDGDLVVLQARKCTQQHTGGLTPLGNLRLALHRAAVEAKLLPPPTGFKFLWITDFPLFTPTKDDPADPGQGGSRGLASTHHPFTSPKTPADIDLLLTDPLAVKADHYDLVVNGVELGGGSRRIHNAAMQELIMREVLGMSDERVGDFSHLLEVLRAGCPPHAGIALGFDRLVAVLLGKESLRDVIAFPKSGRGEDGLVGSPGRLTEEQLRTYHLELRGKGEDGKGNGSG